MDATVRRIARACYHRAFKTMDTLPPPDPPRPRTGGDTRLLLGLIGVGLLCLACIGFFLVRGMMARKLPTAFSLFSIAKFGATTDPNVRVLSTDDARRSITTQDKKTGKTTVLTFDGSRTKMPNYAPPPSAGELQEASAASAQLPLWVPMYPGTGVQHAFLAPDGTGGSTTFVLKEAQGRLANYYSEALKKQGFEVATTASNRSASIRGEDRTSRRVVSYIILTTRGGSAVTVTYQEPRR